MVVIVLVVVVEMPKGSMSNEEMMHVPWIFVIGLLPKSSIFTKSSRKLKFLIIFKQRCRDIFVNTFEGIQTY